MPSRPGPPPADPDADLPRMTLAEHLDELRVRVLRAILALFVAMVGAFLAWRPIWELVARPYAEATAAFGLPAARLLALSPGEGFVATLKLCFLAGFVIASPVVIGQLWGFVAAGLYRHERRIVRVFFPVSVGLFALGVVLAYEVLIPFMLSFLIGWNLEMGGVGTEFRVDDYLSTCLTMVFGMAVVFQTPLVMLFLQATNLVARRTFVRGWRVAVLLAFVVGMLLTDPSPVTQVAMALPIVGLYFLGIYGGLFVGEGRRPFRWHHAWPLLLGALLVAAMLLWSDELNAWSAEIFGVRRGPPAPGAAPPAGPPAPAGG